MRAIEQVLRRPGMSFGKCMILCGGPAGCLRRLLCLSAEDWPTSVLAGILRLSLVQCTIGGLLDSVASHSLRHPASDLVTHPARPHRQLLPPKG